MYKFIVLLFILVFVNGFCLAVDIEQSSIESVSDITEVSMETKVANVIIKKIQNNPKQLITYESSTNNSLVFEISPETHIFSRLLYEECFFINLKKDMVIIVEYEEQEGKLIAKNIEILKGLTNFIDGLAFGIIKEVNLKQGYILLNNATIDEKKFDELLIYIDRFTKIRTSKEATLLNQNILKSGQELRIITSGLLTTSSPPETVGLEVILILLQ
ncbi:hypothetical protein AN641_01505 [Candidatus Epulonipiscioides gigas]|nr:hypothetical protein AN641_01505 [Epulopiscium sp. SCG-C07WGA-EpuloA2]